jgi:MFS family permease
MWLPDTRSLRRHRDFRIYFTGQAISLIGSWMQGVAQAWLVYRLTNSELTLGAISFAMNLPVLFLAPAAGWVADRYPRRTVVILTHVLSMLQALALAVLTLAGEIRVEHVFVLAVVFGIANAFEMPARHTLVGDLVSRENRGNAIALNSSMINVTRIIGPAMGGWVVYSLGEGLCFAVNALSFVAALVTLFVIHAPPAPPAPAVRESPLRQMADGFAWVRSKRPIAGLLLLLSVASFMSMPYMVLLPVFAKELGGVAVDGVRWPPGGEVALGLLQSMAGIGALAGALALSRHGVPGLGRVVVRSALMAGISLVVFAISRSLLVSMVLILPVSWALMRHMAGTNTLLQTMVPDAMRGRVMSFYSMMLVGMAPFGSLAAGALASRIGAHATVMVFGGVGALIASVALFVLPKVRAEAQELLAASAAAR